MPGDPCADRSTCVDPLVILVHNDGVEELLSISDDSLEKFLFRWYGEPDLPSRPMSEVVTGVRVPTRLRTWFNLTSQWSGDIVTSSGPPDPLDLDVDNGKLIFWVDGQGSWEWSVAISGEDPPVFEREVGSDWVPTRESLSEFLLHVTVLESALGAQNQCYAHGVPGERLVGIISSHSALPLPALTCPSMDAQIYVGSETLLQVAESMSDCRQSQSKEFDISVASTSPGPISDTIGEYSNIPWKLHSRFVPQGFSPGDLPDFLR